MWDVLIAISVSAGVFAVMLTIVSITAQIWWEYKIHRKIVGADEAGSLLRWYLTLFL